jgi:hypothetical protein
MGKWLCARKKADEWMNESRLLLLFDMDVCLVMVPSESARNNALLMGVVVGYVNSLVVASQ